MDEWETWVRRGWKKTGTQLYKWGNSRGCRLFMECKRQCSSKLLALCYLGKNFEHLKPVERVYTLQWKSIVRKGNLPKGTLASIDCSAARR